MDAKVSNTSPISAAPAHIVREYAPVSGTENIHGVTCSGSSIWVATGTRMVAFDPVTGKSTHSLNRTCDAGTAFDGTYLYQIAEKRIDKINPATNEVVASVPAPGQGRDSGLTWAEGFLWVGQYRDRKIHKIDPATGAIIRTIESDRFVTGVTWVNYELWHGTWEDEESDIRRIDPHSGEVLQRLEMPADTGVSGLEYDGAGLFYCGGGPSGTVRAISYPKRGSA